MTNEQIIFDRSMVLMEQGILKGSGEFGTRITEEGEEEQFELPESIHTFNGWKARGYQVKKGEKAVAKFNIWKHTRKMLKTDTESEELNKMNQMVNEQGGQTSMFMQMSAFFTAAQVEPIKAKA